MSQLSDRIRRARTKAGLSQLRLATQLSVSRTAVAQWESPHGTQPTARNLIAIAQATSVCFNWLVHGPLPGEHRPEAGEWVTDPVERQLVRSLRELDATRRTIVSALLDSLGTPSQ